MKDLDEIVYCSLTSFAKESLTSNWRGRREREAVSLYVFRHLLREVAPEGFLKDASQIGIEFPVPQVISTEATRISGRSNSKGQVCKDIVLWPRPAMTCWDELDNPTVAPASILEWKFDVSDVYGPDVEWLTAFSNAHQGFIGYAIAANRLGAKFLLRCTKVTNGVCQANWLCL